MVIQHLAKSDEFDLFVRYLRALTFLSAYQTARTLWICFSYWRFKIEIFDFWAAIVTIHYRHIQIKENDVILFEIELSLWVHYFLKGFLPIWCLIDFPDEVQTLKHRCYNEQWKLLVVGNQAVDFSFGDVL